MQYILESPEEFIKNSKPKGGPRICIFNKPLVTQACESLRPQCYKEVTLKAFGISTSPALFKQKAEWNSLFVFSHLQKISIIKFSSYNYANILFTVHKVVAYKEGPDILYHRLNFRFIFFTVKMKLTS